MTLAFSSTDTYTDVIEIAALRRRMRGELLETGDGAYNEARRLVNAAYDMKPALIARCKDAYDVAEAVIFAREHDLEIAVRSGGHSVPGHSAVQGGMMIDLSTMKAIDVDPARRIARVQPGVNNGELVLGLAKYGLATTTGTCATVGMGGSSLGGGIGWLMGRFGMTIDNMLECEVVTAEGDVITASANQHPDLFWALRGGGGNFGIVTSFTYQVHPLEQVLGGMLVFHQAAAPLALRVYREVTNRAPDELLAHAVMATVPNFGPALIIQAVYSGADFAEGERVLAPLRRFGPPAIDMVAPRSYAETYMMLTPPTGAPVAYADASYTLRSPSDAALDELVACARAIPNPMAIINMHQIHGAATRVAPDATAFALREPHYAVLHAAMWMQGNGAGERAWVRASQERMAPFASAGLYVNFLGDEGQDAIRASYRANYARLAAIKARYDADNVFHRNQNIHPAR